jgi:carboxymethylenebutenolidase
MKKLMLFSFAFVLAACSTPTETPIDRADNTGEVKKEDRLNDSPRHHEWVEVQNGDRTVYTWVVYPERSDAATSVMVIHENRGLNDWARSLADQVAEAGYIAVAPDLLSGFSEEFTRTSDFADDDAARDALYELSPEQVQSDLEAVAAYAKTLDASNGKLATAGFCWGGAKSFEFAAESDAADASLVFYGTSPEDEAAYDNIETPVYGFYGGDDERVNSTISRAVEGMSGDNKVFETET